MNARLAWVAAALAGALAAQQRVPLDGTWQIRPEAAGDDAWRPVAVPAAFETALGVDFDGIARYRRPLPLPPARAAAVRVEFAAVATHATVFCNGVEVGSHLGGWTPFRVDVTGALRWDGRDSLEVVVDERVGHNTQGFLPIVQPHFGGIWQGVTLCVDDGPVLDRFGWSVFGTFRPIAFGSARGSVELRAPLLPPATGELHVIADVLDGDRPIAGAKLPVIDGTAAGAIEVPDAEPWSPATPRLYTLRCRLIDDDRELDRHEQRFGFRALAADGTRVSWNGTPLQLRGILHWGYSPPDLAPPTDLARWRAQLGYFKGLGFNCVKCCLWVPPRGFYELCDELGLLVWQEYPTWHPQLDQAHKQELLTEYAEFFALDRRHASVAVRSITCETGQGADLDVVKSLYDACKQAVPDTLVVDDSSWIGWQRITDFWDEHPYGNNSWFPDRLAHFREHIATHGAKPLLLGECIAADTWVDAAAWRGARGDAAAWWRPDCWQAQIEAERWLVREFGPETLASLLPLSKAFALRNRQFQIEQLRLGIPDAGYVVSVARDIPKCRMGFFDDLDRPKWSAEDFAWQRDTMLCLDLPVGGRALGPGRAVPVRVSHYGSGALDATLRLACDASPESVEAEVALAPGAVGAPVSLPLPLRPASPTRVRVTADLRGSHAAQNQWELWLLPKAAQGVRADVIEADALTPALLDQLVAGANVLLLAGDRKGSPRTEGIWFLKGAPFAPPHPAHALVPRDLLLELSSFDLESGRVMPWRAWRDQVDPILAFWETHDIPDVRFHLQAFDARVGDGRLLVTSLRLDGPPDGAGAFVRRQFAEHLATGPAPRRALSAETIAALRAKLTEQKLDLPVWRFRIDPEDRGLAAGWFAADTDTSGPDWRDLRAGSHWENQGEDLRHYTGVAWYRVAFDVPDDWQGLAARAVFEGVDDSFVFWLDGERLGAFGDPATGTTVWLERQVAELGERLAPGRHTVTLRVVDHAGAGGLWKPVFLTTGPATGDIADLLH